MRQCHWSRAKMYGRHSGLFGSSLGLGIFKSCKKNRNYHSDRADYDSGDRAGPAACHGFREVAKKRRPARTARPRLVRRLCVAPAFGLRPRARLRPRLCTTLVTRREDQSASSERLYNLLVVGRPLQLSRWVEAIPASNSLAAATGNGAFWPRQETTSGTMRSRRRQGGRHDGSGLRPA
jgi:hypothetical protein